MARPKYWDVWRDVRKTVKTVAEQELRHAWKQSELRPLGLRYLDSRFRALPAKVYKKVLAYNTVDRSRYKSEHFDCDIFAVCPAGDIFHRTSRALHTQHRLPRVRAYGGIEGRQRLPMLRVYRVYDVLPMELQQSFMGVADLRRQEGRVV